MFRFLNFDSKIESLSKLQKLELYLLPLLLAFLIYLAMPSFSNNEQLYSFQKQLDALTNKRMNKSYLDFMKEYTKFINENALTLKTVDIKQNRIYLKVKGEKRDILKLLFYVDSKSAFSSFESFILKADSKEVELSLYVAFKEFYIKNKKQKFEDFFEEEVVVEKLENSSLIGEYKLVNKTWVKVENAKNK